MTIADLTERALIARITARASGPAPDWLITGIGDDAAVIAPARGMVEVLTTDMLVEEVHARRAWSSPEDLGYKAVAINLSDLAAMGASPRAVLLSMALPPTLALTEFDGMVEGALGAARVGGATLVGGNLSRSPGPVVIDVTATGVARARRVLRRAGARPGDRLFVTGRLGAAAAGLRLLHAGTTHGRDTAEAECLAAQRRPAPRLRTGVIVARNRAASACMDVSDGLADAVRQVADASGCGAELAGALVPRHPLASLTDALTGGEDYELLFAVPPRRTRLFLAALRQAGETPAAEVGVLTKDPSVVLVDDGARTELGDGFSHF